MYNKKIKKYKETNRKEKLWDELGEELGLTGKLQYSSDDCVCVGQQSLECIPPQTSARGAWLTGGLKFNYYLLVALSVSLSRAIAFN